MSRPRRAAPTAATPPPADDTPLDATPLSALPSVSAAAAKKLKRLSLLTVQDLLFHLPSRYRDLTRLTPIAKLQVGDDAVVAGVIATRTRVAGRRQMVCRLEDRSGALTLRFFRFSDGLWRWFAPGMPMRCVGELRAGSAGLEIHHPEQLASGPKPPPLTKHLAAVYPSADGLRQDQWRAWMGEALACAGAARMPDLLAGLRLRGLPAGTDGRALLAMSLRDALAQLHTPAPNSEARSDAARGRLALEELVAHLLSVLRLRAAHRSHAATPMPPPNADDARRFAEQLGFEMTAAQRRVALEIQRDLARSEPMMRLVQGDVGCGKTVLAAWAALQAARAGVQTAVMAPTELLAEQHGEVLGNWLSSLEVPVTCLTGRIRGRRRTEALARLASGEARLAIGTHALFQSDVAFHSLGLVIIDEQHRFGVHQRLALRDKQDDAGAVPHQLIMTATPIPRSLALSAYASLDRSVVDAMPPGRRPVVTALVNNRRRDQVIERIRRQICERGEQCYWVCVLIEESGNLQAQAVNGTAKTLREELPELRVSTIHGQMKAAEKAEAMAAFRAGDTQLLVATTVIEVGVDVPAANLMIVENAERLGLAQLHQLRGRVGRGGGQGYCVLMYQEPLSELSSQRLEVLRRHADGFAVAECDLELRGPGELLGTRQAGKRLYRVADLPRDGGLLVLARAVADALRARRDARADRLLRRWFGERQREEAG